MEDIICNFWEKPCRFCSNESTYCACTYIRKQDGHYIGYKIGYIKSERGQYCNNMNLFMKDVKYCGAQFALTRPGKRRVDELATKCAIEMQKRKEVTKRKYTKKTPVVEKRKYVKKEKPVIKRKYTKRKIA